MTNLSDGVGQACRRVDISIENIADGVARFLPEQPSVEHRSDVNLKSHIE